MRTRRNPVNNMSSARLAARVFFVDLATRRKNVRLHKVFAFVLACVGCAPSNPPSQNGANRVACSPESFSDLAVTLRPQETAMWCWAASGQMVMEYLGTSVRQCDQANAEFGMSSCPCFQCGPNPQVNPSCVSGGWPEFGKYGFTFARTHDAAISWDVLKQELSAGQGCGRRPVAFSWHWTGDGGHVMVATGYSDVGGTHLVTIKDPAQPCVGDTQILTYAAFVQASGHTHWDDFYEIHH